LNALMTFALTVIDVDGAVDLRKNAWIVCGKQDVVRSPRAHGVDDGVGVVQLRSADDGDLPMPNREFALQRVNIMPRRARIQQQTFPNLTLITMQKIGCARIAQNTNAETFQPFPPTLLEFR